MKAIYVLMVTAVIAVMAVTAMNIAKPAIERHQTALEHTIGE